jgi:hypothetical protein
MIEAVDFHGMFWGEVKGGIKFSGKTETIHLFIRSFSKHQQNQIQKNHKHHKTTKRNRMFFGKLQQSRRTKAA